MITEENWKNHQDINTSPEINNNIQLSLAAIKPQTRSDTNQAVKSQSLEYSDLSRGTCIVLSM